VAAAYFVARGDDMSAQPALNNWPLELWRQFATDHLRLEKVVLSAAISPEVYEAKGQLDVLCSMQRAHFEQRLADTVNLGPDLAASEHLMVLGRKGVGKTTLAQRIVSKAAAEGGLCFFLRAMKYRGDFAKMLQQAVAPFSSLSPKDLVRTAELCGAGILVVLDGVDQINDDLRDDLLSAAAGFFERHPCRVVVTTSFEVTVPPNIRGEKVVIPELILTDRQAIYNHYASDAAPTLDVTAFPTPQDLKLAAQAAARFPKNATPALVYDAYIRIQLGHDIASVGMRVCRAIAHEVFSRFSPFLSHQEFDELAERELAEAGAPVSLVDRIKMTRLFDLDVDGISFAHDLLVNHLVAAELVQTHRENLGALGALIAQPLYRQIAAEIISRTPDAEVASAFLGQFPSVDLFRSAHDGELGLAVKDRFRLLLGEVLDRTERELDSLQIECVVPQTEDSMPFVSPVTTEEVPPSDLCALEFMVQNMDSYFPRIAEILDRYGKCVLEATGTLAKTHRLPRSLVTTLYLQGELVFSKQKLRCSRIAHLLAHGSINRLKLSPAVINAFDATFAASQKINPIADFVLCGVWAQAENPDVSKNPAGVSHS
jgi:hypothetical protein